MKPTSTEIVSGMVAVAGAAAGAVGMFAQSALLVAVGFSICGVALIRMFRQEPTPIAWLGSPWALLLYPAVVAVAIFWGYAWTAGAM